MSGKSDKKNTEKGGEMAETPTPKKAKTKLTLAITLSDGKVLEVSMTSRLQAMAVRDQLVTQGIATRLALIKIIE